MELGMIMERFVIAAIMALFLSLSGYTASAASAAQPGAASVNQSAAVNSKSTFILIRGMHMGGMRMGPRMGGPRMYGPRMYGPRVRGMRMHRPGRHGVRHRRIRRFVPGIGWVFYDCYWPYDDNPWCDYYY
jgi:hypothetical protein